MKGLFLLVLLFICKVSLSQTINGDTLLIKYTPSVKYIKYGDRVYEIISPSLQEISKWDTNIKLFESVDSDFIIQPNILNCILKSGGISTKYNYQLLSSNSFQDSVHFIPQKVRKKN